VFSDYQCPFCKQLDRNLDSLRQRMPDSIRIVYRSFPLSAIHHESFTAAIAAECAAAQGQFAAMHTALFTNADSLGRIPWRRIADRAAVTDVASFTACLKSHSKDALIRADSADGIALGVAGTPTFMINGVKGSGALSTILLDSIARATLRKDD
jgi:protein-disulfide isomerase